VWTAQPHVSSMNSSLSTLTSLTLPNGEAIPLFSTQPSPVVYTPSNQGETEAELVEAWRASHSEDDLTNAEPGNADQSVAELADVDLMEEGQGPMEELPQLYRTMSRM
jgi:hypothetical protein